MTYLLGYIVAVLLAVYLVTPFVVWRRVRILSKPEMQEIGDPDSLPEDLRSYCRSVAGQLADCGFTHLVVASARSTHDVETFISLFTNESTGQSAAIDQSINPINRKRLTASVQFWTILESGREVVTGNSQDAGATPNLPLYDVLCAPSVSDVRELYQLHCWREATLVPSDAVRYVPALADGVNALAASAEYHLRILFLYGQVAMADEQHYRWRLPAAFMITWRILPPMKQFARWTARRRARRALVAAMREPMTPPARIRITHESPYGAGVPSYGFPVK